MEKLPIDIQTDVTAREHSPGGYRQVWSLSYPVIITMVSQTLTWLLMTMMVGRIGTAQLGAAGLGSTIAWTFLAFFNGLISSASTFVAQSCGAKQYKDVGKTIWHYLYIAIASYVIVIIFAGTSGFVLKLIGSSDEVKGYSNAYLRIQLYFGIGNFVSFALIGFFRGIGDTKTPMYVTIAVNGFNLVIGYLLVFGKFGFPRLEVIGAALANGISSILSAGIYLAICLSKRNNEIYTTRDFYLAEFRMIRRIARIGAPAGAQFLLDNTSFSIFAALMARMGDVPLAASNAAMTLLNTSFMPLFGISVAATTLVGQFIGANEIEHARKSGYTAIRLGVSLGALVAFVFFLLPRQLISLISKDPEVIGLGAKILMLIAISRVSDGFGVCAGGALRGAGDTKFPMLVGLSYAWVVFIPLSYVFGYTFGGGAVGAWVGATIYFILYSVTIFLRFYRGKWESIKI